jgi:hypothetical protein
MKNDHTTSLQIGFCKGNYHSGRKYQFFTEDTIYSILKLSVSKEKFLKTKT